MGISISGLGSSGLDTTQIISDLMDVERVPLTNLETKKSDLRTEQNVFRGINTKLSTLNTAIADLKYNATFNGKMQATTSGNSVAATAGSKAAEGTYQISDVKLATSHTVYWGTATTVDDETVITNTALNAIADLTATYKVGNHTFTMEQAGFTQEMVHATDPTLTPKERLTKLADYLNQNSANTKVNANVIDINGSGNFQLVLQSTSTGTGTENEVSITKDGNAITSAEIVKAQDASFKFNGISVTRSSNEIKEDDLIAGVSFKLQAEGTSTISVNKNVSDVVSKIENFVAAYNDLVSTVKTNLSKPADENTINPLQGDSLLRSINDQLYNLFNEGFGDVGNKIFMDDFGLSIDKGVTKAAQLTGQITLDKTKLTEALSSNADDLKKLFAGTTVDNGFVAKVEKTIKSYTSSVSGVLTTKITGYDAEIKVIDERLEAMERGLQMKEARLKQQFTTMDTLINSLNSQKDWLTSQFEALNKSSD